jgi:hypothetical protein
VLALDAADLVLLAGGLRGAALVGEQLLDVELEGVLDRLQAARTGPVEGNVDLTGHEDALHHRLQPQPEPDVGTLGNADELDPPVRGRGQRALQLVHRAGAAAQLTQVHEPGVGGGTPGVRGRGA